MAAAYRHADVTPNHTYSINTIRGSYCKLTLNLKNTNTKQDATASLRDTQ